MEEQKLKKISCYAVLFEKQFDIMSSGLWEAGGRKGFWAEENWKNRGCTMFMNPNHVSQDMQAVAI